MKIVQEDVDESLDNAVANGFSQWNLSADEVAVDMGSYDPKFGGLYEELIPFIEDWKKRHPND